MRRGEIWTAAGGPTYLGNPRPVVIVQDDRFDATDSVTICAFTTDPTEAPLFRLPISPTTLNALSEPCSLMVDKITTVRRSNLSRFVGRLSREDQVRFDRAVAVFLGLGD
jgi:mRNA interferase MazF